MRTLIYIDPDLAIALGALLIGSSEAKGSGASLNLLLQSEVSIKTESVRELRDLLPEQVFYKFYKRVPHKFKDTKDATWSLATHEHAGILPGTPVSVCGTLSFPELQTIGAYDPFHPPHIDVTTFDMYGETCFSGKLEGNGYRLPIYFPESSKGQVCFVQDEPVEIVGVVKWSPGYMAGGGKSLNMLIRAAALLLG